MSKFKNFSLLLGKRIATIVAFVIIYFFLTSETFLNELHRIYQYWNISPDNDAEEAVEALIKTKTGVSIELSPYNQMEK